MATQAEYIAAAKALAQIAEGYIEKVPGEFRSFIPSTEELGQVINEAAVKAVDAAEQARAQPVLPEGHA